MAIKMIESTIRFDPTRGRRQREPKTVVFGGRRIRRAEAVLKGFNVSFADDDHHIRELEIDLDERVRGKQVDVYADLVLRDGSGRYNRRYQGWIQFVVIADVV